MVPHPNSGDGGPEDCLPSPQVTLDVVITATATFRVVGPQKKAMPGRRIHVYSDYVPGRVNSKYYGFSGTGDIYRSELPLVPDKSVDHAIYLSIPAHGLASVVDAPREGGSGARKVNKGSNALSEQIAMPDAC